MAASSTEGRRSVLPHASLCTDTNSGSVKSLAYVSYLALHYCFAALAM